MNNEKNELLNPKKNNNNEEEGIQHHSSLPLQPIHLTPQQQFELAEHLSPLSNIGNNNIQDLGLDRLSNSNSPSSIKSITSLKLAQENADGSVGSNKEKKKKDKKKKKKKNKKSDGDDNEQKEDDMYQHEQEIEDNFNDDQHYNQYSNEMNHFDKNIKQLTNDILGGDNDMYMVPKKEKKKNKKKQKEIDNLSPEERRIREEAKDAKSFFSNERTFLSWIGLTFSLGAIGTAIITWFGTEGVSLATGLFLWIIAILFMAYSTIQFRRRGSAIRNKTQGPFDDQKGPLALVSMVFIGVSIYLVFFVVIRPSANIDIGGRSHQNSTK